MSHPDSNTDPGMGREGMMAQLVKKVTDEATGYASKGKYSSSESVHEPGHIESESWSNEGVFKGEKFYVSYDKWHDDATWGLTIRRWRPNDHPDIEPDKSVLYTHYNIGPEGITASDGREDEVVYHYEDTGQTDIDWQETERDGSSDDERPVADEEWAYLDEAITHLEPIPEEPEMPKAA